jgi:hypothetical protein
MHKEHGLVPVLDPSPWYPARHTHWFCDDAYAGDWLCSGHTLCTLAMHHDPSGHGTHVDPFAAR